MGVNRNGLLFSYSYKLGLDEEDHEEYLEEMGEDSEEEDEEESDEEDEEGEEDEEVTGKVQLLSHPLPPTESKGSIITCCPRILRGSCNLDRNLPRLSCGHFAVPTRDVAIQGKEKGGLKTFVRTIRKVLYEFFCLTFAFYFL